MESLDSSTANTLSSLDENTTNSLSVMEVDVFVNYLKKTVSTILHGDKAATTSMLDLAFDDSANLECIKKFLSDPNTATIFVQKSVFKGLFLMILLNKIIKNIHIRIKILQMRNQKMVEKEMKIKMHQYSIYLMKSFLLIKK